MQAVQWVAFTATQGSKYGGDHGTIVSAKSNAVPILKKQLKNCIRKMKGAL
ncbi:hypothetical protein [Methanobacterium spitsbergense]|uniref:hypothetical protein n=1 Tax=Methanobacterium spitsbergense TaxID=2874285 RepID=UPI001CBD57A9|nr:hypothetical protein [Methanobacterium spitsbergense]